MKNLQGTILKGVGGRYVIDLDVSENGERKQIVCHARGSFRHAGITPLPGDRVILQTGDTDDDVMIAEIAERKNAMIRPPLANLDLLFVVIPAARPMPDLTVADKLIAIAEANVIETVVVVTKSDIDPDRAASVAETYRTAGFETYCLSSLSGDGVTPLREALVRRAADAPICAFAGMSGVGKSTLLNALFPSMRCETGEISHKIERGKNTTRVAELTPMRDILENGAGYLADTPGFSLLDFTHFDFFSPDDLVGAFREFRPFIGRCRYTKCTHRKEDGCAILQAVRDGSVPKSRHDSYLAMYEEIHSVPDWVRAKRTQEN